MSHFCTHNQPRLKADTIDSEGDSIHFDLVDATNEYIAEVPHDRAEEGRAIVETIMKTSMASVVSTVPIEVEAEVRSAWG